MVVLSRAEHAKTMSFSPKALSTRPIFTALLISNLIENGPLCLLLFLLSCLIMMATTTAGLKTTQNNCLYLRFRVVKQRACCAQNDEDTDNFTKKSLAPHSDSF